jgi:hypothetical protein
MKKTSLLFAILVTFCYQASFADSIHSSEGCCPSSTEAASLVKQKQQIQLDNIQYESEEIGGRNLTLIDERLQKAIADERENSGSMDSIQKATEIIPVSSLHHISQMVAQHLTNASEYAHK